MRLYFLFFGLLSLFALFLVLSCGSFRGIPLCPAVLDNALVIGSGAIHGVLLCTALFFLWNPDWKALLCRLGLPGKPLEAALYTIGALIAIFAALFTMSLIMFFAGINDQEKVAEKIGGLPLYILAFAVILAPLSEELFFRGLLVPRLGILGSSALFSLSHITYGSVVEVAGVFLVGIILGYVFRRSGSIAPCILSHMLYNGISITVMRLLT